MGLFLSEEGGIFERQQCKGEYFFTDFHKGTIQTNDSDRLENMEFILWGSWEIRILQFLFLLDIYQKGWLQISMACSLMSIYYISPDYRNV